MASAHGHPLLLSELEFTRFGFEQENDGIFYGSYGDVYEKFGNAGFVYLSGMEARQAEVYRFLFKDPKEHFGKGFQDKAEFEVNGQIFLRFLKQANIPYGNSQGLEELLYKRIFEDEKWQLKQANGQELHQSESFRRDALKELFTLMKLREHQLREVQKQVDRASVSEEKEKLHEISKFENSQPFEPQFESLTTPEQLELVKRYHLAL